MWLFGGSSAAQYRAQCAIAALAAKTDATAAASATRVMS